MTASAPLVTVLVPTFNAAPFLRETLQSALRQSVEAIEVIVIDDGSEDGTSGVVRQFADPRLRLLTQAHQGAPAALNAGLAAARGEFVGFLDHDDLWMADKVARHLECFGQHPHLGATFSWYGLIDERGRRIGPRPPRWRGAASFRQLFADFVIGSTSSLIMRRSAIFEAGGFDRQFPRCHDFDLVLRVSLHHPIQAVPEELTLYRRHSGQMSRDWRAMHAEWGAVVEKLRRIAPAEMAPVERMARANVKRYYACLAYEEGRYREAAGLIYETFRARPRTFWADWRNWRVMAACCSGVLLPAAMHRGVERFAGIRAEEPESGQVPSSGPL